MSLNRACRMLGRSKQAYYAPHRKTTGKRNSRRPKRSPSWLAQVEKIRCDMPRIGGKKLYHLIRPEAEKAGHKFGRKKFFALLKKHGLLVKRRKKLTRTTDSSKWLRQYGNLVEGLVPHRPEQVWVSDITYIRTEEGFVYAHLLTDAYSTKLMGFAVAADMNASTTLSALRMALRSRKYREGKLIHHSDRGHQYCSKLYEGASCESGLCLQQPQAALEQPPADAQRDAPAERNRNQNLVKEERFLTFNS